jgi:hypothetical protein
MRRINPYKLFVGAFIPNWLLRRPELTPGAKLCYARLAQYAGEQGVAYPGQDRLAHELAVTSRQVRSYLQELEALKLIGHEQLGKRVTNRYFFYWHAWMDQPEDEGSPEPPEGDRKSTSTPEGDRKSTSRHPRKSTSGHPRKSTSGPVVRESVEENQKEENHANDVSIARAPEEEGGGGEGDGQHVHVKVQAAVRELHRCWWPLAEDSPRNGELWDSLIGLIDSYKVVPFLQALQRVNAYYVSQPTKRPTTWQDAARAMRYGVQLAIDDAQGHGRRSQHAS